jgi:cytidylate kinase
MAILTISRQFGSGAEEIGEMIAKEMGYRYLDWQMIIEDMKKFGSLWVEKDQEYDEKKPDLWESHEWTFQGYVALSQSKILKSALDNNCVLVGRGSNFLLRGVRHHLGIRIEAPLEKRVKNVTAHYRVRGENAKWLISKMDREMAGSVYMVYGRAWDDPREYDICFDTGKHLTSEIVQIVKAALEEKEELYSPESQAIIALRQLAASVKAGIATDPSFTTFLLGVQPNEEGMAEYGLTLRAVVSSHRDVARIKEMAKKLAGGVKIDCQVKTRMPSRFPKR